MSAAAPPGARIPPLWLRCLATASALADASRVRTEHVRATLLAEAERVAPNDSFWVGLRFEIEPGWHTCWKNPGDSGLVASVEWELPEGLVAGDIRWPIPERFATGHLMSYGYAGEVVLLTRMSAWPTLGAGSEVVIAANARWLVCDEVCIMEEGRFETRLPTTVEAPADDPHARPLIGRYVSLLPSPAEAQARFEATSTDIRLRNPLPPDWPREAADVRFCADELGIVDHAAPQRVTPGKSGMELTLARGELEGRRLSELRGVLVLRYADGTAWFVHRCETGLKRGRTSRQCQPLESTGRE